MADSDRAVRGSILKPGVRPSVKSGDGRGEPRPVIAASTSVSSPRELQTAPSDGLIAMNENESEFFSADTARALPVAGTDDSSEGHTDNQAQTSPRTQEDHGGYRVLKELTPRVQADRFSKTPFLALLPRLSEVKEIVRYRQKIASRLKAIHSHVDEGGTEESIRSLAAEEGMLQQAIQWFGADVGREEVSDSLDYDYAEQSALYELGRMYLEMGYFGPCERIFGGLVVLGSNATPARLALAVAKLERGQYDEASNAFRIAMRDGPLSIEPKLGLGAAFLARGETQRAASLLGDLRAEIEGPKRVESLPAEVVQLWRVLFRRCASDSRTRG